MNEASTKKRLGKSLFRQINDFLHLWLGLTSGLIVFIVSITGCIYVFENEIRSITQPYQFVEQQAKPYLLPSQLKSIAAKYAFGNELDTGRNKISGLQYGAPGKAAITSYINKRGVFTLIYINPYSGKVLKEKASDKDFFGFILMGHFYLWLPAQIGQPVVASAVLIFVIMLITGIIMWWPKNLKRANANKSFKIKWNARFKRVNYDLHNVLGFYAWLIALIIALTGLVWGFQWFEKSLYWVTSGGKTLQVRKRLLSDTMNVVQLGSSFPEDRLWLQMCKQYKIDSGTLQLLFPENASDVISVIYNPSEKTFYKREMRCFDRYTLNELKAKGMLSGKFEEAALEDKISRMNYDIHVGAVLGLPGKILAFLASFICASLPITGFVIWWGKRKKKSCYFL